MSQVIDNATAGKTVTQQRRAVRRLLRDLVIFTGTAINELAAAPRQAPQRKRQRLLHRRADSFTDAEVANIVVELGIERVWRALDRVTQPELPLVAAIDRMTAPAGNGHAT